MYPTPSQIVAQARGWLGTPFHHQGRRKGHKGGCDCLGFIIGVLRELQVPAVKILDMSDAVSGNDLGGRKYPKKYLADYDKTDYGRIPDGKRLQAVLEKYLFEVFADDIAPGNLLLMRFDRNPQHVALVSDYNNSKSIELESGKSRPDFSETSTPNSKKGYIQKNLGLIHCYANAGKVVEHRLDKYWQERIVAAYGFFKN